MMDGTEMRIAMVEIPNGQTWEESKIMPKTPEKKKVWDRMKAEYENLPEGAMWWIPDEIF